MLLNNFYSILRRDSEQSSIKAVLAIKQDHPILKGHFPGQPVVPGVCMLQIIKELVQLQTNSRLNLVEADNIKFLSVIDPQQNNTIEAAVNYDYNGDAYSINASLFSGSVVFFKLKATLQNA